MDLAIPSWFLEEDNQVYVLLVFFITIIMVPAVILAKTADNLEDDVEVIDGTRELMITSLMQTLDKNI